MIKETVLSRSMRLMFAGSIALGLGMSAQTVYAQENVQRVDVIGSSIKRLAAQTSLPISTMRAEEFAKQGLTTAQEVLNVIPMNQTTQTSAQTVGSGTGGKSSANLRGLGADKTLVLLNGRRIANHPINADSVDLNMIPVAALDRVEVLRDGASAIYGTDAIGGVINFITKRTVTGLGVMAEIISPQQTGGSEHRINVTGGFGDFEKDGFNVFGVFDFHDQRAVKSTDREFSKTGVIPSRGLNKTSGTPFPANFASDNGIVGNPSFASGCMLPFSIPRAANKTCRFDFTQMIDDIPRTYQEAFLGKLNYRVNADTTASAEYLHSRSTNESRVAPPPLAGIGLIMHGSSPFYPGKGITPAVPGLTGEDLDVSWRPMVTGQRKGFDTSTSDRLVGALEGSIFSNWEYKAGLNYSVSRASSAFAGGYVIDQAIIDGVGSGLLNPFGAQTAAGEAYLKNSLLLGEYLNAKMTSAALDFKVSNSDLMKLGGGGLGAAFGAEFRKDKAEYRINRALASQASSSGYANALDQTGDRTIWAVFAEINAPITKQFEISAAARYDRYNDFGSTFNPKVSFRFEPMKELVLRGSYNTGFRAPTLYDMYGVATVTNTANTFNDPVLCPGGTALPGVNPNIACDQQQNRLQGGNKNVKPEKSSSYSLGVVWEPTRDLTFSLDYFSINLKDQIGSLDETAVFGNYAKYKDRFVYSADGKTLQYIVGVTENLGEVKTNGVDVSATWRLPKTDMGRFTLNLDGTYNNKYEYQREKGGVFVDSLGRYVDTAPVFRWRHNITLGWSHGPWSATLSNKYMSGYVDQNDVADQFKQNVSAYSTWAISGTYTGFKNTSITAGVKNLLNTDPPFTNQGTTFQQGYDPRFTDPVGRAYYIRANYKF